MLSNYHLEQFEHAPKSKLMLKHICDIFENHTLLNKLAARRNCYTATMSSAEENFISLVAYDSYGCFS